MEVYANNHFDLDILTLFAEGEKEMAVETGFESGYVFAEAER